MRPAHRAEMRELGAFLRQGLVVELARLVRIEPQVELVLPAKLETRLGQCVVPDLRAGMAFCKVRRVGGDLIGDDAVLHVLAVRQPEVFLRRDITEHGGAEPADHCGADRARDVVVAGRDVRGQRPERIERRLPAVLELQVHVLLDELHRHVARALDHHLHVVLPGDVRELAQRLELGDLRLVVGVVDRTGPQAVAKRERNVVGLQDFADLLEARVEEALLVVSEAPLRHDRAAARDDARHPFRGERDVRQPHAGVHGEVIDALLALFDERVAVDLPRKFLGLASHFLQRLVDRHRADGYGRIAHDPLARLVDVLARGEVHHRVRAPARRPCHLLDLFLDAGRQR